MNALRTLIPWLLDPAALIGWGLLISTLLLVRSRAGGPARWVCAVTAATHFTLGSPVAANAALGWLESRAAAETTCGALPAHAVIVVLAGGIVGEPGAGARDHPEYLREPSLRRTLAGVRLAQADTDSVLLFSGGTGDATREADLMASLARQLGIPDQRIDEERDSRSTLESASRVPAALRRWPSRPVVLVTSAMHMPRASAMFRHAGLDACTHPVDFRRVFPPWHDAFVPQLSAVSKSAEAYREIFSLLFYRVFEARRG